MDGGKAKWQLVRSPRRVRRGPKQIDIRMFFRAHEGGPLLAEADDHVPGGFCNPMTLTVMGDHRTFQLEAGKGILTFLRR